MILAATGLRAEAALIARPGITAIACGGNAEALARQLEAAIAASRPAGIISIGICGGLDPALRIGALVIGTGVGTIAADAEWTARLAQRLPGAVPRTVAAVEIAASAAAAKAALFDATGAAIVDMESQVVARIATRHRLPFAILRAVSDRAADTLPHAARVPLTADGGVRLARVLAAVARRPWEIPALLTLAGNTNAALKALGNAIEVAGEAFAGPRPPPWCPLPLEGTGIAPAPPIGKRL